MFGLRSDTEAVAYKALAGLDDFVQTQLPKSVNDFRAATQAHEAVAAQARAEVADLGARLDQLSREASWALWTLVAMSAAVAVVELWRGLRD